MFKYFDFYFFSPCIYDNLKKYIVDILNNITIKNQNVVLKGYSSSDLLYFNISEPDEDSRQDQGEEDQQPGLGRRQHPQGQHGGGGGGRAGARPGPIRYALDVSASCWIARFLLGPLEQEPSCRLCTPERKSALSLRADCADFE